MLNGVKETKALLKAMEQGAKPMTNGDRIRAMSDEELADTLYKQTDLEGQIKSCQNLPECEAWLETPEGILEHKCKDCLLKWLQQPAKEDDHE